MRSVVMTIALFLLMASTAFGQLFPKPVAITTGATNVQAQSATLNGRLTQGGGIRPCQSQFRYRKVGTSTWTETDPKGSWSTGDTFSETVHGLSSGTQYEYQCRAQYLVGHTHPIIGDWSSSSTFTTDTVSFLKPVAITIGATNIEAQSATLNGKLTQCGMGRHQSQFRYRRVDASTWTETNWKGSLAEGDTFSEDVDGLTPDTQYEYQCRARNLMGMGAVVGDWSSCSTFTTPPLFPKPVAIATGATPIEARLATLNGKLTQCGMGRHQSQFRYRRVDTSTWTETNWKGSLAEGDTFSETAPGLTPNTQYEYQCRARILMGLTHPIIGDWSSSCTFRTPHEFIPLKPVAITTGATNIQAQSATLNGKLTYDVGRACRSQFAYRKVGGSTWTETDWKGTWRTGDTFSETVGGLTSDTQYEYRCRAKEGTNIGDWSSSSRFGTDLRYYTVTVCDPTHGLVTPWQGDHAYLAGSSVDISATPSGGFARWDYTGGVSVDDPDLPSTTMTVNGNGTLCPAWNTISPTPPARYTVTVCTPTGGSVSPSPGDHTYTTGTTVSITASPDSDFVRWNSTGGVTVASAASASTTMTVNADGSLCPEFEKDPPPPAGVCYVDDSATGANNGSSWVNAYTCLQDALATASSGTEIRVGQGTYEPDLGRGVSPGDPKATFDLRNGVSLYGGYAGFGAPDPDARDVALYETLLSGDLLGNDSYEGDPLLLYHPSRLDNSYHVVNAQDVDSNAVLDGFTIAGGNANVPWDETIRSQHSFGGGLYNRGGSPTIANCTFSWNTAQYGAGMYNYLGAAQVTNCVFVGNCALVAGGGMRNASGNVTVVNCTFMGNVAWAGAGMDTYAGRAEVANCVFSGNWAQEYGGGIRTIENHDGTRVINCSFSGNTADGQGGGLWSCDTTVTLANSILWGNSDTTGTGESGQICNDGPLAVSYCCVQGWTGRLGGRGNFDRHPLFRDADGPDDIVGTEDDDLALAPGSPCIDAGDNAAVPTDGCDLDEDGNTAELLPVDLSWCPRFQDQHAVVDTGNGLPPIVDIGAYEYTE